MHFFLSLLVEGALAGAVYALIALAFVVVYNASRVINFALGEWLMLGALLVATGAHVLGAGFLGALAFACAGMFAVALIFNRLVLQHLIGQPLISILMVMLGVGALFRGLGNFALSGIPSSIPLPISPGPIVVHDLSIPSDKLIAAFIAGISVGLVAWFHHRSRTGVALRAIADDQQAAMAAGINVDRHLLLVWCMAGAICVVAGTLWIYVSGGGFGMALVGLKIFPIVIIGGLDSIPGTIIAAIFIGVLEVLPPRTWIPFSAEVADLLLAILPLLSCCSCGPLGCSDVSRWRACNPVVGYLNATGESLRPC